MELKRGMRDKLDKYLDLNSTIEAEMTISGPGVYDFCCFGVDMSDKLSDDRYMIFYNQTKSPQNEITYRNSGNSAFFTFNLSKLPPSIQKLVFTVSIDGNSTMGIINSHSFTLKQNGNNALNLMLYGSDFKQEKAIITVEIYRKDTWRINAIARGFNGGLGDLLRNYGGEEIMGSDTTNSQDKVSNAPNRVNLVKSEEDLTNEMMSKISSSRDKVNLEKHVVNLSKCVVDLRKKTGFDLGTVSAKVVVVLDYSGSMSSLYSNGTVQRTINKLVPLGLTFDDNGTIDVYLFSSDYRKIADLNLSNYSDYVSSVINKSGYSMGGTRYSPVLKSIIEGGSHKEGGFMGFGGTIIKDDPIVDNYGDPTFVLFITDGENADQSESDAIIRKSSNMNVFIQFIGIGNERFNYLIKLDDLSGRTRDNTGFSKMRDLDRATDNELYSNILGQFSAWLKGLQ